MADKSGRFLSFKRLFLMRFISLRQDHKWTLPFLHCHQLHHSILELPPTASFHTGTTNRHITGTRGKPKCPFCKGSHSPSTCDIIKDPKQCTDIVRQQKLCFNCLGHHKVASCNSKHRCHNCEWKHHTSLCSPGQQPTGQHPIVPTGHPPQPAHSGQQITGAAASHPITQATTDTPCEVQHKWYRSIVHDLVTITYHTEQYLFTQDSCCNSYTW